MTLSGDLLFWGKLQININNYRNCAICHSLSLSFSKPPSSGSWHFFLEEGGKQSFATTSPVRSRMAQKPSLVSQGPHLPHLVGSTLGGSFSPDGCCLGFPASPPFSSWRPIQSDLLSANRVMGLMTCFLIGQEENQCYNSEYSFAHNWVGFRRSALCPEPTFFL